MPRDRGARQCCQQPSDSGGKCPQDATGETSSLGVGDLGGVVVVTGREGGEAHAVEVLLQKDM